MDSVWARDARTLDELVETALQEESVDDEPTSTRAVAVIQFRGSRAEFERAKLLAGSPVPSERALGAKILGQLGWGDSTFLDESIDVLLGMLGDADHEVLAGVVFALGHRGEPRVLPFVVPLKAHSDDQVRFGVAFALGSACRGEPAATAALIELTRDRSRDVRNWATFAFRLDEENFVDSDEVREALIERVGDPDGEIQNEALLGLAMRRDPRVASLLAAQLSGPSWDLNTLEAVEHMPGPALVEPIRAAWVSLEPLEQAKHREEFTSAIQACGGEAHRLNDD